jgi:hypothetical protein
MANYDWQLSRVEPVRVLRDGFEPFPSDATPTEEGLAARMETIWAATVRLPIQTLPVDEPEQQLWRIVPSVELGPGVYAIHWGALDGDPGTEASAYLLEVVDPNAPPEPVETEPAETEAVAEEEPEEEMDETEEAPEAELPAADDATAE